MMKRFSTGLLAIGLLCSTTVALADTAVVAVSKGACGKVASPTQPFILVLNSGDDLLASISQCAKEANLPAASISGLGQVHNPTLAYFTSDPKAAPALTTLSGYYELASFTGNVTSNNGEYYTHAHGVLADKKFRGIAGHINASKVGLTAEITIIPLPEKVERTVDPKTGFGSIVTQ